MRIRSIRTRLTLWYTGLLTLTLLAMGAAAYGLMSYSLSREMDTALHSIAKALVEKSRSGTAALFPSEVDELFRRFFGASTWDRYFQLFDPLGRRNPAHSQDPQGRLPLSQQARENAARGISTLETLTGSGDYPVRVITMPVLEGGRTAGLIQVGMSLQNASQARRRFLLVMAGVLPLGLLFSASGGWLLADRALKPVDRMTDDARRINAERLAERLEESGAGDELDKLARTLNEMLSRLDGAFTQVRRFSADASHQLQTPLTILKGELELALRSPRPAHEYRLVVQSALEEVDRMAHLVEGLLLLARAEGGFLRMDHRPVELDALAMKVIHRLRPLAGARGIDLELTSPEPVTVQGDPERLEQLLLNLVENAIKYGTAGRPVRLTVGVDGKWAALGVSDEGPGIPAEEQEKIFHPFYRFAPDGSLPEKGSGLGLSIARSIARAHAGDIQVESGPGSGCRFLARLPLGA